MYYEWDSTGARRDIYRVMMEVNYEEDQPMEIVQENKEFNDEITEPPLQDSNSNHIIGVDRKKTCPFMVKMYCRINGHHRLEEFSPPRFPVEDEMIVYTWRNATLKELSILVREVLGDSDLPGGVKGTDPSLKFSFNLLYPDVRRSGAHFLSKSLGWAFEGGESEARAHQLVDSSTRTLDSFKFVPGDFIDVAIYTNPAMIPKLNQNVNINNYDKRRRFYSQKRF